ncbi:MAG: cation diffusion facilitator family transporter [Lachnospiraceae bacterium]|nr:cation diffusion facilitator family transporter [Lachnospiraceae bacterium]
MITILSTLFIKDYKNTKDPVVRRRYGMLSGIVGIILNLLLFTGKFIAGLLSGSIAITADAFNNLSDAGSSVITLIGFKMAGQEADSDHPFGHGRIEYISGLLVSVLIILMGYELCKESVKKIISPSETLITPLVITILLISVLVKCYMYYYNHRLGKQLESAAMEATATDSLSDTLSTGIVFLSALIGHYTGFKIDGPCGLLIGFIILYAGYHAAKETAGPLLGQAADPAFVQKILDIVDQYDDILGIHDMIVHDYGPGKCLVSFHAEVPAKGDILALHDTIDLVEYRIRTELACEAVIHMDPIMNDDEETNSLKKSVEAILNAYDVQLSLHDFRIVKGPTHTNLIFDVVVPFRTTYSVDDLKSAIQQSVFEKYPHHYCVIQIDHPLTARKS